jgi:hypothetical protein
MDLLRTHDEIQELQRRNSAWQLLRARTAPLALAFLGGVFDGGGACPPEDCGGPGGYERLPDVLADPAHPDRDEVAIGRPIDPEAFDRDSVDAALGSRRGRRR